MSLALSPEGRSAEPIASIDELIALQHVATTLLAGIQDGGKLHFGDMDRGQEGGTIHHPNMGDGQKRDFWSRTPSLGVERLPNGDIVLTYSTLDRSRDHSKIYGHFLFTDTVTLGAYGIEPRSTIGRDSVQRELFRTGTRGVDEVTRIQEVDRNPIFGTRDLSPDECTMWTSCLTLLVQTGRANAERQRRPGLLNYVGRVARILGSGS